MITKPTDAHKCIKVTYIVNIIGLLHVSATVVATLMEQQYKGMIIISNLSNDRSKASSKTIPPHSAI